jgi:hypothetical protein
MLQRFSRAARHYWKGPPVKLHIHLGDAAFEYEGGASFAEVLPLALRFLDQLAGRGTADAVERLATERVKLQAALATGQLVPLQPPQP